MRGSAAAWESLQTMPERISNDTLYFIYEDAQTSTNGKLYLGQKLISGTDDEISNVNINDIGDIFIDNEVLADKQILVYNEITEQWENTSLSTIINTAVGVMHGASSAAAGESGLVPAPSAGDENKFLRGDGSWAFISVPTFNSDIFTVNNNEVSINGFSEAPVGTVLIKTNNGIEWSNSAVGTLNRQIITWEKLQAQLNGTDPEPLDPNIIYMVSNDDSSDSTDRYSEYMIIGGALERLGTFGAVNLNNYITTTTFNTAIGSLEDILYGTTNSSTEEETLGLIARVTTIENNYITQAQIGNLNTLNLSGDNTNLVEEVNSLGNRLKWHDLSSKL